MPGHISERARSLALCTPDGFLAFGFGSGLLTAAPGTMGTLAAVPFALMFTLLGGFSFWFLMLALFLLGVWLCGRVTEQLGVDDYGGIVWDEMFGYWLAVAFVPMHWAWFVAAFALFRFFDIVKPWPISEMENAFDGGLGIMMDDVMAALYTMVLLGGVNYAFFSG
ncbi:MAG: phosphatidylglycerophosphatase A [Xanthomonadales bacterium]|nr:phosphatidylglycerophosphatase A [Xanthomonadales bacterium]NIX13257.1 phosphatidylglycerophosphatase A [Xanthomonadales bacterium]